MPALAFASTGMSVRRFDPYIDWSGFIDPA
jgi:hypothetical protein